MLWQADPDSSDSLQQIYPGYHLHFLSTSVQPTFDLSSEYFSSFSVLPQTSPLHTVHEAHLQPERRRGHPEKENEWGQSLPPHPSTTYWDQVAIGICPWSGAGWSINQKGICLYCREQATFLMDITSLLFIPCGALEALCSGNLTAGDPCMFYRDSWYLK